MHIPELRAALAETGAGPGHTSRFLRSWTHNRPLSAGRAHPERHFPQAMLRVAPALQEQLAKLVRPVSEHPAADGSRRLLLALQDGKTVETVLLPRQGVCVSTQLGCAVGCRFCMTGRDGLIRQLGSAEIVAQVVHARSLTAVRKVVFMGMGEPAHNLTAVLEAIDVLGQEGQIAHKQLVFSTVGDPRAFEALAAQRIKPALALSLHTTRADLRRQLLPRAPDLSPQALIEAAAHYAELSGYPVQVQWTLMHGVNDGMDEWEAIVALMSRRRLMLNLIPFNDVEGSGYRRPSWEHAADMARWLNRHGVYTRLRRSAGQDVEAGCGQLRTRQPEVQVVKRRHPLNAAAPTLGASG
ncbi:MAG: RNA methyltransferase [Betaproteobacteria bacterium]|nr:RNA methyltransferase [Betaproteobacteria bacterium]